MYGSNTLFFPPPIVHSIPQTLINHVTGNSLNLHLFTGSIKITIYYNTKNIYYNAITAIYQFI